MAAQRRLRLVPRGGEADTPGSLAGAGAREPRAEPAPPSPRALRAVPAPLSDDSRELDELEGGGLDLPAAIVCARCGQAECECALSRSGVHVVVPFERPGDLLARTWRTARLAAVEPESFFRTLPDGPVLPALGFALLAEGFGVSAMVGTYLVLAVALAPEVTRELLLADGAHRVQLLLGSIPVLSALLVLAHVLHGLSLEWGARRVGARPALRRALRFGGYSAGWDLVIGPLGAVLLALSDGWRAGLKVTTLAVGLPTRASRAFLSGAYGLEGEAAVVPVRASWAAGVLSTVAGAVGVIGLVVLLVLG